MNQSRSLTSSTVIPKDFLDGDYSDNDRLFRVYLDNGAKSFTLISTSTKTVRDGLTAYRDRQSQDIGLLCSVVFWQKRTIDYQALHTAFLLNSLSEEEFEQEADKFTVHQKDLPPDTIASVVERLDSLIGIKFDTSDYADYFQCSQQNVMAGLRLLKAQHFTAMLPEPIENNKQQ